ncbi:metallophosphoesterase family protein [Jannaschia sp. CCS1]|uniref:metallophosphoesterase family protein n=1 Tax=Jannaschia sp. (strain CCS1) TaxID=290400 RepID=UPI000053C4A8|nr:metallophosphoesterase family protein [Jannaschia sp. CCS1]ABD56523.1 metallophosphoesterase [Jannaschia sp. CCS1]
MTQWKAPAPEDVVYVIGDIHGSIEKLDVLLSKIDADISTSPGVSGKVVFVGDYIDRGDASADVLRFVAHITTTYPDRLIGLMGNHERMMLDFLANPTGPAKRWIRFGGLQTMANFGVGADVIMDNPHAEDLLDAAGDLMEAMGQDLVDWLNNLPLSWSSGTLWVVHAGAKPSVAMDAQLPKTLLWGSDRFMKQERDDGQWVAFGHQPFDTPFAKDGRIAVDTGAVYGGPLTAARVDPSGDVRFLTS